MEITGNSIVGDIVRVNFKTAQLFDEINIDYCCEGNITIDEACNHAKVDIHELLPKIESLLGNVDKVSKYIETLPLNQLCNYIEDRHHGYINDKAPFIQQQLQKLCKVHGKKHSELLKINQLFDDAIANLTTHMKKEELINK